jgi:hypothetical protein
MFLILSTVTLLMAAPGTLASETLERRFPQVSGANLEKRAFDLPRDFEGRLNLVFVAFKREQQPLVDTWLEPAREMAAANRELRYYELPTIYKANRMVQWWIDNGMRRGIPDKTARETTITLYLDKQAFRSKLDIPNEDDIYIFLVDNDGLILWRSNGEYNRLKAASLQSVIDDHGPRG